MVMFPLQEVPAGEYFQQEVNYRITVALDDKRHELHAFQSIEYINNSPDTLGFLYFHLWPNAYSGNNTRLAKQIFESSGRARLFDDPELRGYMDSLDFRVEDLQVEWNLLPDFPDICRIFLNSPLMPGDTIIITTPFRVKIPKGTISRMGHIGQSYQISQWYPKPAVYDITGWHPMPYLDQGEFYSEFGSFDVSITLPANYIVGATGNLQNPREMEWLDSLAADNSWKITMYSGGTRFPPSSDKKKTLRYTEDNVHDFAWFADKRFHVMKGNVTLPDSGREVTTWVMFTNLQARLWQHALGYVDNAILFFSELIGDYPYNNFTAVQSALSAGLGMEYPGITVIGYVNDDWSLDEVIAHEIAHSWFYGALGSNERRYPFMDEGTTSAYTTRYMKAMYPERRLWEVYFHNRKLARFFSIDEIPFERLDELQWQSRTRMNLDQPADLSSTDFSDINYVHILYYKAAIGFDYLRAYLGDPLFDSAMQAYYLEWKFRHPGPDDLRSIFESHTGLDLGWFFDDFIGTTKRLDYKIVDLNINGVLVKNNAELVSPLVISGMSGDSILFEKWIDGFAGEKWIDIPAGDYSEIIIDPRRVMPELSRLNNNIRTSGIFPRLNPVKAQFLFTIEDPAMHTLIYVPLINWNNLNGFTPGIALHNGYFLPKPLEYLIVPFYSTKNNALIGFGQSAFNITPYDNFIRLATVSINGARFGVPGNQHYHKLKTGLDLHFRPRNIRSSLRQRAFGNYFYLTDLFRVILMEDAGMESYFQAGYGLDNKRSINPFNLLALIESHSDFRKASVDLTYRYSYFGTNQGLGIRLFAGKMLKNNSLVPFHSFAPSGRSGREQYLYGGIYLDRFSGLTENFWSRQISFSEGGLVTPVNQTIGYSDWLVSLSLTSTLPGKVGLVPVRPFVNFLLNDHRQDPDSRFFYEAGLKAGLWDLFEIYFPLIVSENIASSHGSIKERARFVFTLNLPNTLRLSD
jgi:hypothetical protein